MSPHNVTHEQLVQFALGELSAEQAHEIQEHLRRCQPCRRSVERLQTLLDCADRMSMPADDEKTAESANRVVLLAVKTNDQNPSRRAVSFHAADFGRTIMNHRMTKWAVAAVVVLAVLGGWSLFAGGGSGRAYARMVSQLQKAQTLSFSAITPTGLESMPTVRMDLAYRDTGHVRIATADGYVTVLETMDHGVRGISLMPPTRNYVVFELTNVPDDPAKDPWVMIERLKAFPARADKSLGRRDIDGRTLDGFEVSEEDETATVWIDAKTDQLVRVEMKFAKTPGMNVILSDFQLDVPLEDSFFSIEPPEGYTSVQLSADVSQLTEQDFIEFLRLWSSWTVDASFPPTVSGPDIAKTAVRMAQEGKFVGPYAPAYGVEKQPQIMYRGLAFMSKLLDGTWRYAGQNVSFGDPAVPIFWYQPAGSSTWRIIYADLHVTDATAEQLPK